MAGASSAPTVTFASSGLKEVYNPKAVIPHAASLRQAFAHCARFPTAASRRSLGRVSVPVWPVTLSGRLPVVALVGHHPTNKLIGRGPIPSRSNTFHPTTCAAESYPVLDPVSQAYPRAKGRSPTCYSPVRRSCTPKGLTARLACVKHAASVRPEPGSNSPSNAYRQKTTPTPTGADIALITSTTTTQTNMALTKQHTVEFSKNKHTPSRTTEAAVRSGMTLSDLLDPLTGSDLLNSSLPGPPPLAGPREPGDSSSLPAARVGLPTGGGLSSQCG